MIPTIPSYQPPVPVEKRLNFSTPEPVYVQPATPSRTPAPVIPDRTARIRAAAHRAPLLYDGPIGELVRRELEAAEEFGRAIDAHGLTMRVVDHILGDRL